MSDADRTTALADAIVEGLVPAERFGSARLLEVGIGERTTVAAAIASRDVAVTAIDVVERSVPPDVGFRRTDVTDAETVIAELDDDTTHLDGIYALRLPPELHASVAELAGRLDVPAAFTTLGGEPPGVPASPQQLGRGETIFWIER